MLIDILVIVILVAFVYYGSKRGLIITSFRLLSFFIAIAVSRFISPYVTQFLDGYEPLRNMLHENILGYVAPKVHDLSKSLDDKVAASLNMPAIVASVIVDKHIVAGLVNDADIARVVADYLTETCISVIALAASAVLTYAVLYAVSRSLRIVSSLPIVRTLNRLGGGAVGGVFGLLVVWAALAFAVVFVTKETFPLNDMIIQSVVTKYLQEMNIFIRLASSLVSARY